MFPPMGLPQLVLSNNFLKGAEMRKIEVLVPTAEAILGEVPMAKRPNSLEGKVIGFMWNAKPNGDILLKNLERILKGRLKPSATIMRQKLIISSGAPAEVIEELSATCDFVILAIGD